jgi:hypothetical protein
LGPLQTVDLRTSERSSGVEAPETLQLGAFNLTPKKQCPSAEHPMTTVGPCLPISGQVIGICISKNPKQFTPVLC